jgi:hypothetical protein
MWDVHGVQETSFREQVRWDKTISQRL